MELEVGMPVRLRGALDGAGKKIPVKNAMENNYIDTIKITAVLMLHEFINYNYNYTYLFGEY